MQSIVEILVVQPETVKDAVKMLIFLVTFVGFGVMVALVKKSVDLQVEALKVQKDMQKNMESIMWSCSGSLDKLAFVEKRMEGFLQLGGETARHLVQLVREGDHKASEIVRLGLGAGMGCTVVQPCTCKLTRWLFPVSPGEGHQVSLLLQSCTTVQPLLGLHRCATPHDPLPQARNSGALLFPVQVHEFDMQLSAGSLKWALRSTLELYQAWRTARILQKGDCSKASWNLVVESARRWVQDEVEHLLADAETADEGRRVQANLQAFAQFMPQWWAGAGVEDPMGEFSKLENMAMVRGGMLETSDDAHLWSAGVSFRTKELLEPNTNLGK
jgi:hypothetical protein